MNNEEFTKVLMDTQKEYSRSNRAKDKIIALLIIALLVEAIAFFGIFCWYEAQFDYVVTETVTETEREDATKDVNLSTDGDNANAEYNDVAGDQYNDNATHNEGVQEGGVE